MVELLKTILLWIFAISGGVIICSSAVLWCLSLWGKHLSKIAAKMPK